MINQKSLTQHHCVIPFTCTSRTDKICSDRSQNSSFEGVYMTKGLCQGTEIVTILICSVITTWKCKYMCVCVCSMYACMYVYVYINLPHCAVDNCVLYFKIIPNSLGMYPFFAIFLFQFELFKALKFVYVEFSNSYLAF